MDASPAVQFGVNTTDTEPVVMWAAVTSLLPLHVCHRLRQDSLERHRDHVYEARAFRLHNNFRFRFGRRVISWLTGGFFTFS